MKRRKFLKWLGFFFCAMLLFTVASRAADSVNTAKIRVKSIQNYVISHRVSGSGKVEGIREIAVFAEEGQRVERVLAREGQVVKKGDVLFTLSADILEESIEKKNGELEELRLQAKDLESAKSVNNEKKSRDIFYAEQNYNTAANSGNYNISSAQDALNLARQKLDAYYQEQGFTSEADTSAEEQALLEEIRTRQEALNQAIMARDQAVMEAQRNVSEASQSSPTDSSLLNVQRQIGIEEKTLGELQQLLEKNGEILAPADGMIKAVSVATGGLTGSDGAMVLYELSGDLQMNIEISKEDVKYVEVGGSAYVKGVSGTEIENASIQSIREDETDQDKRIVSIVIPENTLGIGESADVTIINDAGPFAACIPLSALYGETGKEYVLVVDTQNTVLGEVLVLRKVSVTVEDKNESFAALSTGSLTNRQQVVIEADRSVEEGSRVRLEES